MIKGLLKSIFIAGLTLLPISFSSATLIDNGYNVRLDLGVRESGNFDHTFIQTNNLITLGNLGGANWKFMYDTIMYDNIRQIRTNNFNGGYGYYFRNNGRLVFHKAGVNSSTPSVSPTYFVKTTLDRYQSDTLDSSKYTISFDRLKNSSVKIDRMIYGIGNGAGSSGDPLLTIWSPIYFCMVDGDNVYCSSCNIGDSGSSPICVGGQAVVDLGLTSSSYIQDIVDQGKIGVSPFLKGGDPNYSDNPITGDSSSIGGYNYQSVGSGDLIKYFEDTPRYEFNEEICYIGTKDLTSVYEDKIPYYQGSGYTIFDLFSKLYHVDSFSISDIGTFVNTWWLNFSTWFMGNNRSAINGDPLYNAYYSYGSGYRLDKGSGLTNPFLGNLTVYYFLGSTAYENNNHGSRSTTPGEAIATYCYKKLYTTKGSPSNDGSTYSIVDDHNSSYDENAGAYKLRLKNTDGYFSGADSIISQSWEGSPLDYFDNGEEITDFKGFFSNAFNKFKYSFGELSPSAFGVGSLPGYIIFFLLAIVFFRFLSH